MLNPNGFDASGAAVSVSVRFAPVGRSDGC